MLQNSKHTDVHACAAGTVFANVIDQSFNWIERSDWLVLTASVAPYVSGGLLFCMVYNR